VLVIVDDYHTGTMHGGMVRFSSRVGTVACRQSKKGIVQL
jgi:hypothetical protein